MTDESTPSGPAPVDDSRRPRCRPLLGIVAVVGILVIGSVGLVRRLDPFDPYRDGTTHDATLTYTAPCEQGWQVTLDDGKYVWAEATAPLDWRPGPVEGRLHIVENWASPGPSAVFEARGTRVELHGGRVDGHHFFGLNCSVAG